jgi:hypothetical protein
VLKPVRIRVRLAAGADAPTGTTGTNANGVPLLTVSLTASPLTTLVRGAGRWLITRPSDTRVEYTHRTDTFASGSDWRI